MIDKPPKPNPQELQPPFANPEPEEETPLRRTLEGGSALTNNDYRPGGIDYTRKLEDSEEFASNKEAALMDTIDDIDQTLAAGVSDPEKRQRMEEAKERKINQLDRSVDQRMAARAQEAADRVKQIEDEIFADPVVRAEMQENAQAEVNETLRPVLNGRDEHGERVTFPQQRNALEEQILKLRDFDLDSGQLEGVYDALGEAEAAQGVWNKTKEEYKSKSGWGKIKGFPKQAFEFLLGDGRNARVAFDKYYDKTLLYKVDAAEKFPGGKVGRVLAKRGIKGISGLGAILPAVALVGLFAFSWLLDKAMNMTMDKIASHYKTDIRKWGNKKKSGGGGDKKKGK